MASSVALAKARLAISVKASGVVEYAGHGLPGRLAVEKNSSSSGGMSE